MFVHFSNHNYIDRAYRLLLLYIAAINPAYYFIDSFHILHFVNSFICQGVCFVRAQHSPFPCVVCISDNFLYFYKLQSIWSLDSRVSFLFFFFDKFNSSNITSNSILIFKLLLFIVTVKMNTLKK